ncbi:MAG: hypothetical protein GXY88_04610, partial [Tissierellia bacterium]|nr:hypothetical protein [Tissierellia bacterium]
MRGKGLGKVLLVVLILGIIATNRFCYYSFAIRPIRLIVDGKDITKLAGPVIENGRSLVPIRFIAEELGAKVSWDGKERRVTIEKDGYIVNLKIQSHLVSVKDEEIKYSLIDVAPKIIDDRTFVPLRLVSNALGIGIEWRDSTRTIYVDSNKRSDFMPFFDVNITSVDFGQAISGKTHLQVEVSDEYLEDGKEIKYLLLCPNTWEGYVIARGKDIRDKYTWIPNISDKGNKILVAAIYDDKGRFIGGDAIPVHLDIKPRVSLTGISEGEILEDTVYLGADLNFIATYVKHEITNLDKGKVKIIGEDTPQDPYGKYKWEPSIKENGNYSFKVIAYDINGNSYESEEIRAKVQVSPKISLLGVSNGQTIDKPVNLLASRNFDVIETEYILRDPNSGKEETLAKIPYGSYRWFPEPDLSGQCEVLVRVKDTRGIPHESAPIKVKLAGKPLLLLEGVGPNQVIRESINLKVNANVDLESVSYILTNRDTGKEKVLAEDVDPLTEQTFIFSEEDEGYWNIKAVAKFNGKKVESDQIPIRVYFGETYTSRPIIEKDKFLDLASRLAKESWKKTGMSAALQTAQSILETGWGQSVPVDKYSGKLSYNLFGIKGKGPQGSVTITTREVYNGGTYYVDAEFRAYNSIEESWTDHKEFLLNSSRYEPFREVMHDSTLGAWALKRSGYATDPEYAIKLIRIIKQYDLD